MAASVSAREVQSAALPPWTSPLVQELGETIRAIREGDSADDIFPALPPALPS